MVDATDIAVRAMTEADWPAVRRIYAEGLATGDATVDEAAPSSWAVFVADRPCRHVAVTSRGCVAGWVAAGPATDRCVYAGVVEHSVYVSSTARGRGVGRTLPEHLIAATEAAGVWTIQSGIFPENVASRRLHACCGFRELGVRERLVRHRGIWRDIVERASASSPREKASLSSPTSACSTSRMACARSTSTHRSGGPSRSRTARPAPTGPPSSPRATHCATSPRNWA